MNTVNDSSSFGFLVDLVTDVCNIALTDYATYNAFLECVFVVAAFSPLQIAAYLYLHVSESALQILADAYLRRNLDLSAWATLQRVTRTTFDCIVYGHLGMPKAHDGPNPFLGKEIGVYAGSAVSEVVRQGFAGGARRAFSDFSGHLVGAYPFGCFTGLTAALQNQLSRVRVKTKPGGGYAVQTSNHHKYLYGTPRLEGNKVTPLKVENFIDGDYMTIFVNFGETLGLLKPLAYIAETVVTIGLHALDANFASKVENYDRPVTSWRGLNRAIPLTDMESWSVFGDPVFSSARGKQSVASRLAKAEQTGEPVQWGFSGITDAAKYLRNNVNRINKTTKFIAHTYAVKYTAGTNVFTFGKNPNGNDQVIKPTSTGWDSTCPKRYPAPAKGETDRRIEGRIGLNIFVGDAFEWVFYDDRGNDFARVKSTDRKHKVFQEASLKYMREYGTLLLEWHNEAKACEAQVAVDKAEKQSK